MARPKITTEMDNNRPIWILHCGTGRQFFDTDISKETDDQLNRRCTGSPLSTTVVQAFKTDEPE